MEDGGLMSLRREPYRLVPARRHVRGQDSQRRQARRSPGGAAEEVRVRDQSESGEADRPDDSAERAGEGGSGNQDDILDFRLPIFDWGKDECKIKSAMRFSILGPIIENLKSKRPRRQMGGALCNRRCTPVCGARADAQQPAKISRIGFLDPSTASGSAVLLEAFRQELSKLGWIEGKNITIEYRFAEKKTERLPELAADLVRLKVDLIVVIRDVSGVSGEESDHYHSYRDD